MIEFHEEAFIEERNIDQRWWREYTELRSKMRSVGTVRMRRDVPGLLDGLLADFIAMAARGNLRRLMPGICQRCNLDESTVYPAINDVQCSDMTLSAVEDAISGLLWSERFDVPSVPPTKDDLSGWLLRWVGSYQWLGEFLGVKSNTITSWATRGPEKQRQRLLDFAQRWYEARLALWPEKPREQFEAEYEEYLLDREDWAEEQLWCARELERADIRRETAEWEPTPDGQAFLEDVRSIGGARARDRAFMEGRPHPKDRGNRIPGKLVQVERDRLGGQKPEPPSPYEDHRGDNFIRFGAPAPASELWMPANPVDA